MRPELERSALRFRDIVDATQDYPHATHVLIFNGSHRQMCLVTQLEETRDTYFGVYRPGWGQRETVIAFPKSTPFVMVSLGALDVLPRGVLEGQMYEDDKAVEKLRKEHGVEERRVDLDLGQAAERGYL